MVGLSLSFDVDGRRGQGAEGRCQLVLRSVPRGAGPRAHLYELHSLARRRGEAAPDRGGAHCLDFAAGDVPGHAGP